MVTHASNYVFKNYCKRCNAHFCVVRRDSCIDNNIVVSILFYDKNTITFLTTFMITLLTSYDHAMPKLMRDDPNFVGLNKLN